MRRLIVLLSTLGLVATVAIPVFGHAEREVTQPEEGSSATFQDTGPVVVVCKPDSEERIATLPAPLRTRNEALLEACQFEHIQPAVNHVAAEGQPGTRILVLPGVYREEPSRQARAEDNGAPIGASQEQIEACGQIEGGEQEAGDASPALSYEDQLACPHKQNLISINGDATPGDDDRACDSNLCDLQLEGTGARPEDVIVDGKLNAFLNGIKADRADGIYLRNLTAQHFEFNGVYILETARATVDDVVGRYNHEYGFLSFVAYVLYENCEGYGNGDSAVYPGASPNNNEGKGLIDLHRGDMEWTTEVVGCRGHHNALGYSGTTGNSVRAHHNEFDHNATGWSHDSLFPGHPGTPQNHALLENNLIHENNTNYFDQTAHRGICSQPLDERDYEDGNVCPVIPLPVGTGIIAPGGNFNYYDGNIIFDQWRQGTFQFWIPAEVREEAPVPDAHFRTVCGPDGDEQCPYEETSHWNTYTGNRMADNTLQDLVQPNGFDFTWDVEGQGNCWAQEGDDLAPNTTAAEGGITYHVAESREVTLPSFPACVDRDQTFQYEDFASVSTIGPAAPCAEYDHEDNPDPGGCTWFHTPEVPAGREPGGATLQRLAGADRIDTAVLASREGYPHSATTVTLARADDYADALAGAPLAHARGGPLLLTGSDGLDPRTRAEIERLNASQVILLGGTAALSPRVAADLADLGIAGDDITRIAGADRFATAAQVARNLPATDALLAKGADDPAGPGWVDALAASSVGALVERPILLTRTGSLPAATAALLDEGAIESVDIVGGEKAVSAAVEDDVAGRIDKVERVAGADRFETSLELAKFALQLGADPTELWLTTGANWPDGVAAGSAVAVDEGVMLLVRDAVAGTAAGTWLDEVNPTFDAESADTVADVLERVRILGGTQAVPAAVGADLRDAYGAVPGDARGDRSTNTVVSTGRFELLPGADEAYGDVSGYAVMERGLTGVTRTRVYVEGLPTDPGTAHPVHVHSEPCSFRPVADNPHYAADPDGPAAEPNEIHPGFSTGAGATGLGDSTVAHHPADDTLSVMIHTPADDGATKVLCADLE